MLLRPCGLVLVSICTLTLFHCLSSLSVTLVSIHFLAHVLSFTCSTCHTLSASLSPFYFVHEFTFAFPFGLYMLMYRPVRYIYGFMIYVDSSTHNPYLSTYKFYHPYLYKYLYIDIILSICICLSICIHDYIHIIYIYPRIIHQSCIFVHPFIHLSIYKFIQKSNIISINLSIYQLEN